MTRSKRAAAASTTHTKHLQWIDENGASRPLSLHPNHNTVRMILRSLRADIRWCDDQGDPLDLGIAEEWQGPEPGGCAPQYRCEECRFAYGVAAVIGLKPQGKFWRLETVEPGTEFAPDTVLWWRSLPRATRKSVRRLEADAMRGDAEAAELLADRRRAGDGAVPSVTRRRAAAAEQRAAVRGELLCDCLPSAVYECRKCALLRRTGEPGPFPCPTADELAAGLGL